MKKSTIGQICILILAFMSLVGCVCLFSLFFEKCEQVECSAFINDTTCNIIYDDDVCSCNDDDISYIENNDIKYGELESRCYILKGCDNACPRLTRSDCSLHTPLFWYTFIHFTLITVSIFFVCLLFIDEKN